MTSLLGPAPPPIRNYIFALDDPFHTAHSFPTMPFLYRHRSFVVSMARLLAAVYGVQCVDKVTYCE